MSDVQRGGDGLTGFPRLVRASRIGLGAFRWGWRNEEALRWEIIACALATPLAFWLGRTGVERALLWGSVVLVFIVELLNTAVEVTVDRISTDRHALSGLAKDLGSLAVGVSVVLALGIWGLVLTGR